MKKKRFQVGLPGCQIGRWHPHLIHDCIGRHNRLWVGVCVWGKGGEIPRPVDEQSSSCISYPIILLPPPQRPPRPTREATSCLLLLTPIQHNKRFAITRAPSQLVPARAGGRAVLGCARGLWRTSCPPNLHLRTHAWFTIQPQSTIRNQTI